MESKIMSSCFVAGIVKGLVERDDPYRHFGSLLGFQYHLRQAIDAGLVTEYVAVTESGKDWYKNQKLNELQDCRAYFWGEREWSAELQK